MKGILIWGNDPKETKKVANRGELENTLAELIRIAEVDGPFTLLLRVNSETAIEIIIGLEISTVLFYSVDSKPQHVGSVGSIETVSENEWVSFNHRGEFSEIPKKYFIPFEDSREAFIDYFTTGLRPNNINWRDIY
jgi:hypothetical protein